MQSERTLIRTENLSELLLLELVVYVPAAIIIGNILPPLGGIKLHWLYVGVVFLNSLLVLLKSRSANGLFIILISYPIIQIFFSIKFSLPDYIDFIAGPLVFIAIVNTVVSDRLSVRTLNRYCRKSVFVFFIPILIAVLQYLEILPLEFMNARYVNVTQFGTEQVQRVNGFLYHGIELAVIIFFAFAALSVFTSGLKSFVVLGLMILLEAVVLIKAAIISAILFLGFHVYFINRRFRMLKIILLVLIGMSAFSYAYLLVPDLETKRISLLLNEFRFEDQLFTGRGFIWNTYIQGIKSFDWMQIVFGGGFGSAPEVFRRGLFGDDLRNGWSPGPHNQILDLFVNGGVFAIWLVILIMVKQFKKLSAYFSENRKPVRLYYLAVVLIPVLFMGITAPIMGMFVFWCGLSVVMLALKAKFAED